MKFTTAITGYQKSLLKTIIILSLFVFSSGNLAAYNYFGITPSPYCGDVKVVDLSPGGNLYAGVWGGGAYRLARSSGTWTEINNQLTNKYITSFAFDSSGFMFTATFGGGVFRSGNYGNTWLEVNNGLTNLYVNAIAATRDGFLFAGTKGGGVFRSGDNGNNWEPVNQFLWLMDINALTIADDSSVVAGTNGGGVFRSIDNGDTWKKPNHNIEEVVIVSFIQNSIDEIFAATIGNGVLISYDFGNLWRTYEEDGSPKNVTSILFNEDDDIVAGTSCEGIRKRDWMYDSWRNTNLSNFGVHSLVEDTNGSFYAACGSEGIYVSANSGRSWYYFGMYDDNYVGINKTKAYNGGLVFTTLYSFKEVEDEKGDIMNISYSPLYNSTDYGYTWALSDLSSSFTNINDIAFDSSGNVYVGTEGGIWKSTNQGANWQIYGLQLYSIRAIGINANGDIFVSADSIDTDSVELSIQRAFRTTDDGIFWDTLFEPTGATFIGINKNGDVYAGINADLNLYKSTDNGDNWTWTPVLHVLHEFRQIDFNSEGDVFITVYEGLYRSIDDGANWTRIKFGLSGNDIDANNIAITFKDTIYVDLNTTLGVLRSANKGDDWDTVKTGMYCERIKALAASPDGDFYAATRTIYHMVEQQAMVPPVLVSPDDGQLGAGNHPTLSWNAAEKAELYELQVSSKDDFTYRIEYVTLSATERTIQKTLDDNKEYWWRIRSRTNSSISDWSEVRSFTTTLAKPVLISPENEAKGVLQTTDFLWYTVQDAENYSFRLALDDEFENIVATQDEMEDTTFNVSDLEPLTTYYWKVQAKNWICTSEWSSTWSFVTVVAPPNLRSPANHSMELPTTVTFEWDTSETADKYFIQISKQDDFSETIFDGQTESNTSHSFTLLVYNTKYYWRVQAANDDGTSLYSEIWDFTTGIEPAILISPEDNSTDVATPVNFTWEEFDGATSYHLQVAADADFQNLVYEDSAVVETQRAVADFESYTDYFWRVRINIDDRAGFWSDEWTFKTGLSTPVLTSPENNATDQSLALYLKWEEVKGAIRYHAQLATDENFANIIKEDEAITKLQLGITKLDYETKYYWRVKSINDQDESQWSGTWNFETHDAGSVDEEPCNCIIDALAYPNPFNSFVIIKYNLKKESNVKIRIINVYGELIEELHNNWVPAGEHTLKWSPTQSAQGIYFYQISIGEQIITKEIIYIK